MKKKIIILILIYALIIVGGLWAIQHFLFKPYACKELEHESNNGAEIKNAQECSLSILFDNLYGEI